MISISENVYIDKLSGIVKKIQQYMESVDLKLKNILTLIKNNNYRDLGNLNLKLGICKNIKA